MIAMGSASALKNLLRSPGGTPAQHDPHGGGPGGGPGGGGGPRLGARRQRDLEEQLDGLAETCENIDGQSDDTLINAGSLDSDSTLTNDAGFNGTLTNDRGFNRTLTIDRGFNRSLTNDGGFNRTVHSSFNKSRDSFNKTNQGGAVGYDSSAVASMPSDAVARSDSKDSVASTHSDISHDRMMKPGGNVAFRRGMGVATGGNAWANPEGGEKAAGSRSGAYQKLAYSAESSPTGHRRANMAGTLPGSRVPWTYMKEGRGRVEGAAQGGVTREIQGSEDEMLDFSHLSRCMETLRMNVGVIWTGYMSRSTLVSSTQSRSVGS